MSGARVDVRIVRTPFVVSRDQSDFADDHLTDVATALRSVGDAFLGAQTQFVKGALVNEWVTVVTFDAGEL